MTGSRQAEAPPLVLSFELPLPPGVNHQYVTIGRRRVLSKPAQAFKRDVVKLIERSRGNGSLPPSSVARMGASLLGVYLTFFFETPRRRDLDGGLKIALDSLASALDFDDRNVVDLHLTKRIDPLRPRLEVQIETIHDWQFDRSYVYLGHDAGPSPEPDRATESGTDQEFTAQS
ncbi:MAG: RusA family crossover junction endodeoxyribonuclease [Chloroflexia bacterium]|nr:RusA family crossover junction endodeoxyribonuclease [Chloroflexia bacterium]MDQ3412596.1 RusA family crossover junction endodeoxyribonuclease [Chloroflexota bacterium]